MARSFQQKVNLISICSVCIILFLLLFFGTQFTPFKIFILLCLMLAFICVLIKNGNKKEKRSIENGTMTDEDRKRSGTIGGRLTDFFENLGGNVYNQSSKNMWNTGHTYAQEIQEYQRTMGRSSYNSNRQTLSEHQEHQLRRKEFNILLPQNINSIVEEIKRSIQPNSHFQLFNKEVERMKMKQTKGDGQVGEKRFSKDLAPNESFCFDENSSNFMLVNQYEIVVDDAVYAVEIVADFLKEKIEGVIRNSHYSFKVVSQIMMKCFGMRVNFGSKQRVNSSDSKEITMDELKEFLVTFTRQTVIYQKFKPIIPVNQFRSSYLQRLLNATNSVLGLVEHIDKQYVMSLKIYVSILNETFKDENILMTNDKSAYSPEMRKAKHVFYVHQSGKSVFFTYNRIQNFKTKNPLVAVLAFFAQNYKTGQYEYVDVVRSLAKRFTEKYKNA